MPCNVDVNLHDRLNIIPWNSAFIKKGKREKNKKGGGEVENLVVDRSEEKGLLNHGSIWTANMLI